MQCKAIQMSSPNTWPPQSWNQFPQAPPQPSYHVHLPCELEALLTSDMWKYYTGGDVPTGRYTSDSVSSDEGTLTYTSDDSDDNNNNNNNNTTNNLNNQLTIPPEVSVADNNNNNNNNNKSKNTCGGGRARVVDEDGFIRRAACLCVDETESKVLLVSSKKDRCSWLVPGGGVEAGEEESAAAVREAWEEAGVQGHTKRYLGMFETKHQSGRKKHRTAVFVVATKQIHAHYPEDNLGRARQWFSIEDALVQLSHDRPVQSAYLNLLLLSRLKAAQV